MRNIAEFHIIGRVSKMTTIGKALKIDLASNYRARDKNGQWGDDIYWNSVSVFDEHARTYIAKHIAKGDLVRVTGRFRNTSYQGKDGTVYTTDFHAHEFDRLARPAEHVEAPHIDDRN